MNVLSFQFQKIRALWEEPSDQPIDLFHTAFLPAVVGRTKERLRAQDGIDLFMYGIFTPTIIGDGLGEGAGMGLQSSKDRVFGGRGRLVFQNADRRQAALALDQDVEPMLLVPGHQHIGFPLPKGLACRRGHWAQVYARSVGDPRPRLPIGPLRFPLFMVAGQRGNQVRGLTINVLVNGFMTHRG